MRRPLLVAAVAAFLVVAGPVAATHVQPRAVQGDQSCGPLTAGTVEFKVAVADITGAELGSTFKVTLTHNVADGTIDFSGSSLPVMSAYIQGETGGNIYNYAPNVTEDKGLLGPEGEEIDNVSVCYVAPPATDTVAAAAGPTQQPNDARSYWLGVFGGALIATGFTLLVLRLPALRRRRVAEVPIPGFRLRG